jgi:hypothetical protein
MSYIISGVKEDPRDAMEPRNQRFVWSREPSRTLLLSKSRSVVAWLLGESSLGCQTPQLNSVSKETNPPGIDSRKPCGSVISKKLQVIWRAFIIRVTGNEMGLGSQRRPSHSGTECWSSLLASHNRPPGCLDSWMPRQHRLHDTGHARHQGMFLQVKSHITACTTLLSHTTAAHHQAAQCAKPRTYTKIEGSQPIELPFTTPTRVEGIFGVLFLPMTDL